MARANRIIAVLRALVMHGGIGEPGLTRGEIRRAAQLPEDTEVTRPARDCRKEPYNIDVRCVEHEENGERVWRYWIPAWEEARARFILASHKSSATPSYTDDPSGSCATGAMSPASVAFEQENT